MNLPSFSVKRPIFTTIVTLILVILGAVSLSRLQIDMLPDIELPTLSIRTDYEGASPEVMERLVTQIIEEIVAVHSTGRPVLVGTVSIERSESLSRKLKQRGEQRRLNEQLPPLRGLDQSLEMLGGLTVLPILLAGQNVV